MRRVVLTLVLLVAASAPAAAVPGSGCGPATAFENERVRIWFQGFKGHVKVVNKAGDGASYDLRTLSIVERSGDAEVASLNLERAYPQEAGTCTIAEDGDDITITYGVTVDGVTVTFVYHFNAADDGAKFDLIVDDWPWASDDGTLAFSLRVEAEDATAEPAENGIGFRDADGNPRGFISWDPEFTARYDDEHEETGAVDATTSAEGGSATATLEFTGVTPGYSQLFYDPWVGVGAYLVVGPLLLEIGPVLSLLPL